MRTPHKPAEDIVRYVAAYKIEDDGFAVITHAHPIQMFDEDEKPNLKLTYDGETGHLKASEVIS